MEIKKLKFMPYAQAEVQIFPRGVNLKSYETIVAHIDGEWLTINGLYSATTRKHIKAFCKEYAGFDHFATIKTLANGGYKMNIFTGEIVKKGA